MSEREPRLDSSLPSALRGGGFLLIAVGAGLLGVGSLATWVTVGIPNESAHSPFRGTDLPDGKVVLACAVVILVGIVIGRLVRSSRLRLTIVGLIAVAGLLSVVVATSFLVSGKDRRIVLAAIGIPRTLWAQLGVFRDLGAGPYLVIAGGVLCIAGAVVTLVWARRLDKNGPAPAEVSA